MDGKYAYHLLYPPPYSCAGGRSVQKCFLCGPNFRTHFKFPTEPARRAAWITACCTEPKYVLIGDRLCDMHFLDRDMIHSPYRSTLKKNVVPSRFLPTPGSALRTGAVPSSTVVKAEPIETEITIKSEPPEFDTHEDDLANVENLAYTHDVEILPGSIKREEDHQYSVRMPSPPKRRKNGSADTEDGLGESEGGKMETARRNHKRRKNSESALPLETEITIEIKTEIKSEPPEFETVDPLENYEESA